MRIQHALAPPLLVASLLCAGSPPAQARSADMMTMRASQLIHVAECDPRLNVAERPFVGYVPGFYRGYWYDAYGRRYYQPVVATAKPELGINYTNVSSRAMSQIEFGLIANGHLVAEVRDVGTFSPGAEIKHTFGLSPNVFPLQTGLARCVPLRVTFSDGAKWKNSHLPALNRSLYPQ